MLLLAAGFGVAFLVWALVAGPTWIRRTREAGGHWSLAAIIYLSGPIIQLIQLTYPNGADPQGIGLLLARSNTVAAWSLGAVALYTALKNPRRGQGFVVAALLVYYASHLVSAGLGYQPAAPSPEIFLTPLLIAPYLLHGGYEWEWLAGVMRRALRWIVVLSLAAVVLLPSLSYEQACCRTIFGVERIQGITGHPNTLAILACFAVILELRGGRLPWIIPPLVAMLFAQSNTGWIALSVSLLVIAGRLGSSARVLAIALGLGGIVLAATDPTSITDFLPPDFFTFTGRTTIWQAAIQGFLLNPWFGYGPNLLDAQYRSIYLGQFDAAGQAHNQYLQTLGGQGIVGLACLILLLVALIRNASLSARATGGLSVALLIAFFARSFSETPLIPQGSTATLLLIIAVVAIGASGAPQPDPVLPNPVLLRTGAPDPPPLRVARLLQQQRRGRLLTWKDDG